MCGLCGVLGGGEHWTEVGAGAGNAQPVPPRRRAERLRRVGLVNAVLAHYGLTLGDWQGASYVLSSRTGRTEIVGDLAQVWQTAAQMSGRPCDPLDPTLVERLEREA
ncbi:MAG: hypothetical protein ACLQJR_18575 [Stellaceae bacterium]